MEKINKEKKMRSILFLLLIMLVPLMFAVPAYGQVGMFGTNSAPVDTTHLIVDGSTDSTITRIVSYIYNGRTFDGKHSMFASVYSPNDGVLDSTVYIYTRLSYGNTAAGDSSVTSWTLTDSLTTTDISSGPYAGGTISGKVIVLSTSTANGVQAYAKFAYSGSDTAVVVLRHKEGQRVP